MRAGAAVVGCILIVVLPGLAGCASTPPARRGLDSGLVELCHHMSGSFSSQAQAERDADFRDIRLYMVRVWPHEPDAVWLYVEQAAAASLDQPYRQRVYRVAHLGGDLYESRVYEFPEPLRLAGAWKDSARLGLLTRPEIEDRQGCAMLLRRLPDDDKNPLAGGASGDDMIVWLAYREAKALLGMGDSGLSAFEVWLGELRQSCPIDQLMRPV